MAELHLAVCPQLGLDDDRLYVIGSAGTAACG
jgi:hypothetical protein